MEYIIVGINLQLFAEGAAASGEGSPAAGDNTGVIAPAAGEQEAVSPPSREAQFDALIKGEYKDLYDARMQDTIRKRLKSTNETVDRYNALQPTMKMLAEKYGVKDVQDIAAISKAIEEDNSFYEDEAMERGISVEQLKSIKKMERENAQLRQQMQEQETRENANRLYAQWMEQEQATKAVYPSFDMQAEMQNQKFVDLLRSNIDVRTAYEVLHKDDIIRGAMQFTAQTVEQKISNKIASGGSRPTENGNASQSASVTKEDVSKMTRAQREDMIRRARMGERIAF